MARNNQRIAVGYGLSDALPTIFNPPIVGRRAPLTTDSAPLGTVWIYPAVNGAWVLTSIVANSATWSDISGAAGTFTSLTVTPGPISLTGTTTINTTGAAVTTIGTGGTGAVNIGNATGNTAVTGSLSTTTSLSATTTVTAGTGITSTTGNIVATAGAVNAGTTVTAGTGITSTTGNIVATAGAVNAGTSMTATSGDITATNGNVVISTATKGVILPGPIDIITGAGTPANGLALHAGDMYINTTPTGATDRIFVATAAGAWTNVTCAA